MSTLVTRSGKGSPLTHNEVDTNFTNLNTDKVEKTAADITGGTINNTTIGATTPSTGVFTTLTATGTSYFGGVAGSEVARVSSGTNTGKYTNFSSDSASNAQLVGATAGANFVLFASGTNSIKLRTNGAAGNDQMFVAHTASAVNYHQLTGSATGSGPIHSVAGSDTNIDNNLTSKGTGNVNLNSGNGTQFRVESSGSAATDFVMVGGSSTGRPFIRSAATSGNIDLAVSSQGTGAVRLYTNFVGQEQARIAHTASAVNYVQVTGAATTNRPVISAQGSDTNLGLNIQTKGTGSFFFVTGGSSIAQLVVTNTASSVNYINVTGGATGVAPVISAQGSDTNIPAVVQPKGTGALQAQQTDSTATGGNARGGRAVDWQMNRDTAARVASGSFSIVAGGSANSATTTYTAALSGLGNTSSGVANVVAGGILNVGSGVFSAIVGGGYNTSGGWYNFIGGGSTNSGTANAAVTTQSGTMNGTTAVTLSGSNASIKVGQIISGTSIADDTYVAAISGTSLTLSKVASGSSTSTLSFYTPHGVVVGGGNNQATGSYSYIGGGGDAGTAANRNVASGAWSVVVGGIKNTASGLGSFVGGGGGDGAGFYANTASGTSAVVVGGTNNISSGALCGVLAGVSNNANGYAAFIGAGYANTSNGLYSAISAGAFGTARGIASAHIFPSNSPISSASGVSQGMLLVLGRETTNATPAVLTCDTSAGGTTNQVILPNNSAYYFKGSVIANVTGGGNTKAWSIEGAIKRGANAASTALVGTPTVVSGFADVGAATWAIAVTADTTNGGLTVTFTGQAATTIRCVAKLETTEVTF